MAGSIVSSVNVPPIIRPTVQVKFRSGKLALSEDGQFLYVAVSNALAIQRYNLQTKQVDPPFPVGIGQGGVGMSVADMIVLRGAPTSLAVARADGFNAKGVAIYDNGVRRPGTTPEHSAPVNAIELSGNSTNLYGFNSQHSGFELHRLLVTENGVTIQNSTTGLLGGFGADMIFEGGLVFGSTGAVINPLIPARIGNFAVENSFTCCALVAPDSSMGRAFFLTQVGTNQHLQAHDLQTFLPLKSLQLWPAEGGKALIRWGSNGLAFATAA
ncbi:MAG: hypothetical protein ACK4UN_22560, partial [Limisphaerales bacterium]